MMYSYPYILLVLIMGICAFYINSEKNDDTRQYINVSCIVVMVVFFGFRGFVFNDWTSYYDYYSKCDFDNIVNNVYTNIKNPWTLEPGFTFLMCVCKTLLPSYYLFNLVCTIINISLLCAFFRNRLDNFPLGFVLFLCFGGIIMSTNLMRNTISILIFANALRFIEERKLLQYFSCCIIALSFHISSLVFFPLFFFLHRKINIYIIIGIFVVGNIIFLSHIQVFLSIMSLVIGDDSGKLKIMLDSYTSGKMDVATGISIGYLERLLTSVLILCYYKKLIDVRKENVLFINSFVFFFFFFFYFSEFQVVSQRLANIFIFSYWILWNDIIKCFSIDNNRKLFVCFMTLYCILKTYGTTNMKVAEYDNVLWGSKSYEERLYLYNRYYKE